MIDVCSIRSRPKDRPMGKGISLLHLYLRLDSDKIQGHILTIHRLWLMTHSPRVWWGPVQMTWTTCVETGRGHIPGTNKTSLKRILQSSISSKLSKTIFSQGASHWPCTVPTSCQGGRTWEAEIWSTSPSFHFPLSKYLTLRNPHIQKWWSKPYLTTTIHFPGRSAAAARPTPIALLPAHTWWSW